MGVRLESPVSSSLTLTIAGSELTECGLCHAMVPTERLPSHVEKAHEGWAYRSTGPHVGVYTETPS